MSRTEENFVYKSQKEKHRERYKDYKVCLYLLKNSSSQKLYRTPVKRSNFINNLNTVLKAIKEEERMTIKRKVNK